MTQDSGLGGEAGNQSIRIYDASKEQEMMAIARSHAQYIPVHILRQELQLTDQEMASRLMGLSITPDYKEIKGVNLPILTIQQANQITQYQA